MTPVQQKLIGTLAEFASDPVGFVYWAFPWGEPGELLDKQPEPWQIRLLEQIRDGMSLQKALRLARGSGHGVGKSAIVAWITLWAISTMTDTVGVITANTETQLKTKTWVQIAKWHRLFIAKSLFALSATKLCSVDKDHASTWRIDMVPWSLKNTEAFAGLHNQGRRIVLIFDEASAIEDMIWEVSEGALTDADTEILWAVFGNPTKNSGRFRECFPDGRFSHRWQTETVDSRAVSFTDKAIIDEWKEDHGEDSDFFRIRVRGAFPRHDSSSFISLELAREAVDRELIADSQSHQPVVLGVDVARFGDNFSVIYPRQGRDARTLRPEVYQSLDTMQLVARIVSARRRYNASMIFVDGGGVGGGVVDRLRQLREPVIDVQFGSKPDRTNEIEPGVRYSRKRDEIWGAMRDWLYNGGCIPYNIPGLATPLAEELASPTYTYNDVADTIRLESKTDMKRRGVTSPDAADALACTFAYPHFEPQRLSPWEQPQTQYADYDPYAMELM